MKHRPLILISACLIGEAVRYDGRSKRIIDPIVDNWSKSDLLVPLCPEVSGGLSIPRSPAEIQNCDNGTIKVIDTNQLDVTSQFNYGAEKALALCVSNGIQMAILTEGSPSCGSSLINDGQFQSKKIPGQGVTTALLRKNNIRVFSQYQTQQANDFYQTLIPH